MRLGPVHLHHLAPMMEEGAHAAGNDADEDIDVDDVAEVDKTMSLAQQAGAVISPSGGKGSKGGTPRVPINNLQEQGKLLASLQQFVESKGGLYEPGWTAEVFVRQSGNSQGTRDAYYRSPAGKRYRSRQEVARAMGLASAKSEGPAVTTREEAYAVAKEAFNKVGDLPRDLECGATLTSWGVIDQRPKFSTTTALHPVGYRATWPDKDTGAVFVSRIIAVDDAPRYTVSMQRSPESPEKVIAEGSTADEAWTRAAERQKKCLAASLARAKALLPPVKKRAPKPKPDAAGAAGASTPVKAGAPADLSGTGGTPATPRENGVSGSGTNSDKAQLASSAAAGPEGTSAAGAPPSEAPGLSATAPASEKKASPEKSASKLKVVFKGGEAKGTPGKGTPSKGGADKQPPPIPPELTKKEERLIQADSLLGVWGAERFGFADTTVLHAMEGLPGVDKLQKYDFVMRRRGGWQAEIERLKAEATRHQRNAERGAKSVEKSKGLLARTQEKRKRAEDKAAQHPKKTGKKGTLEGWLTTGAPAAAAKSPSKAGRPMPPLLLPQATGTFVLPGEENGSARKKRKKQGEPTALEREVQGVMLRLLRVVDARVEKAEQQAIKKAARAAEREQKAFEKEAARCKLVGLPPPQKSKALKQSELRPVANLPPGPVYPIEDRELAGFHRPPPAPQPLPPKGILSPSAFSAGLSALELLTRFKESLAVANLPSLAEVEAALAQPSQHGQTTVDLHYPFVANLVNEMWEAATVVEEAAERSDFKLKDYEPAFPPFTAECWPEVARRFFQLQDIAAMVKALDSSGGLGPAIGNPGNSTSHPLALMDSATVLQTLLAGCPTDPACHVAALPHAAVPTAPAGLLAMQDARALSSCEQLLRTVGLNDEQAQPDQAGENALIAAGRRVLWKLIHEAHGRALCSDGVRAATAAKFAVPLDLHIVAARLDEGVYGTGQEGLQRMVADIKHVCALWRVGCSRPKPCGFARSQGEKRSTQVHAEVYAALGAAMEVGMEVLAQATDHKPVAVGAAAADGGAAAGADGGAEGAVVPAEPKDAIVTDLDKHFIPWSGCGVCWSNEDHKHLLICDETRAECHTYCLSPPLDDIPSGSWVSPRYLERTGQPASEHSGLRWRRGGFEDHVQLGHLLGVREYGELADGERGALLNNVAAALMDTSMMRQVVDGDLEKRKNLGEELRCLQRRLKHEEEERRKKLKEEREAKAARELAQQQASIAAAVAHVKGGKPKPKPDAAGKDSPAGDGKPDKLKALEPEDPNRRQPPTRGTRSSAAEAQKQITDTVTDEDLDLVRDLEYQMEDLTQRGVMLGLDRHWNRYWLLSGPRIRARRADDRVPIVCVETQATAKQDQPPQLLSPRKVKKVGADLPMENATWGCYPNAAALDGLIQWLNSKGEREKPLRQRLQRIRREMPDPTPEPDAKPQATLEGTDPPQPTGAAPLPSEELPSTPVKQEAAAAAQQQDDAPAAKQEDAAALKQQEAAPLKQEDAAGVKQEDSPMPDAGTPAQSPTEQPPESAPAATAGGAREALRDALLAARRALPDVAVDSHVRASPKRQADWQRLVANAADTQAFMAAVVILEGFVKREYLRPWWRLWAFPTPSPEDTGTLAAVWLRLQALQAAVKPKLGLRESAVLASPEVKHKVTLRGTSIHGTPAASEDDASEGENDERDVRRPTGKRKAALDPDEALALRLHEEMNGPTSNADGGRRALRARPQLGGKRARELRAASRNNSTSNLSEAGYRSKLRRGAGAQRPTYTYAYHDPAASDDDPDPDAEPAAAAEGPNAASSDSGGEGDGGDESEINLSDLEDEEDAAGNGSDSEVEEPSEEDDSDGEESPVKPSGRRTSRSAAPAKESRGAHSTRGAKHSAEPDGTAVIVGRKKLRRGS